MTFYAMQRQVAMEELDMIAHPHYDPDRGFHVFWDFISGIPFYAAGHEVYLSWALFEASTSRRDVDTLPAARCVGDPVSHIINASIVEGRAIGGIPPHRSYRLVIELRTRSDPDGSRGGVELHPLGWTSFDLFTDGLALDHGQWRLPIFPPPINFRITTHKLYGTREPIAGLGLFLRILDSALFPLHQKVTIDPSTHRPFYKLKTYEWQDQAGDYDYDATSPHLDGTTTTAPPPGPTHRGNKRERGGGITLPGARKLRDLVKEILTEELQTLSPAVEPEAVVEVKKGPDLTNVRRFNVGIQMEDIRRMPAFIYAPRIRIGIIDVAGGTEGEDLNQVYLTDPAEPGTEEGSHGWPDAALCYDFKGVYGVPSRKVLAEVVTQEGDRLIGDTQLEIFKMHGDIVFDVNDGIFRKPIRFLPDSTAHPTLSLRVYKPAHGRPPAKTFEVKLATPGIPRGAWIAVDAPPKRVRDPPFRPGDAIDLYIDGARFLPDNATISRVIGTIVDASGSVVKGCSEFGTLVDLDSPVHSPVYKFHTTLTLPAPPPTSTLTLKLHTLEKETRQLRLVGTAVLNVFLDSRTRVQPKTDADAAAQQVVLNEGAFQIPVRSVDGVSGSAAAGGVGVGCLDKRRRVPCTTLLVRLVRIPFAKKVKEEPLPKYSDGTYISTLSTPTSFEKNLYHYVVAERGSVTARDVLVSWRDLIQTSKESDTALLTWIQKKLTPPLKPPHPPLLDLSPIARYDPRLGFKLSIDAAQNMKSRGVHIAVVSLCPPATWYVAGGGRSAGDEVRYTNGLQAGSDLRCPVWGDGYQWYRRQPMISHLCAVIDIRCITPDDTTTVQQQGWTVVPIFADSEYVRMGFYQLPLFEAPPPTQFLQSLSTTPFDEALTAAIKSKTIRYSKKGYPSVFVRVCDARREDELVFDRVEYHFEPFLLSVGEKEN
ncbi:Coiled-coil domain-containing protein 17 [Borealophlyctis nickersoniae]|nr:Coiled-coil domain-containing protein 17 [Borealophlyctis nickersoniae]